MKDEKLWELKEAAKWSLSLEERRKPIADLVKYCENALPALTEIKDTTVLCCVWAKWQKNVSLALI